MSHYIIEIRNNTITIFIKNKINELEDVEILNMFYIVKAIKLLETSKGNEYKNAFLILKYVESMLIKEYINIFTLVRLPSFHEFINYFLTFEEKFDKQNTNTKNYINDYLEASTNISQSVYIEFIFKIETTFEELNEKIMEVKKIIEFDDSHLEIINILKKKK